VWVTADAGSSIAVRKNNSFASFQRMVFAGVHATPYLSHRVIDGFMRLSISYAACGRGLEKVRNGHQGVSA